MSQEQDRYDVLLQAIELERKEEERYYQSLAADRTVKEKIESGILYYPLQVLSQHYTVGEKIEVTLERYKNVNQPHKLKSGIAAILFARSGNEQHLSTKGVVSFVRKNKIGIILGDEMITLDQLQEMKGMIGIEMIYDERPYRVMREAIENLKITDRRHIIELREGIRKKKDLDYVIPQEVHYVPPHLNESQAAALRGCIQSHSLSIIHGPPGTGKTTTLVSLIKELTKNEKHILVCAPSNNAVDLLAYRLDQNGIPTIRVGNVTRIGDNLVHLTLDEKARNHEEWKHIKKIKVEAIEASRQAKKYKRSFGQKERSERKMMYKESRELRKWARDMEHKLIDRLLHEAKVICSTLIGVSHKTINDLEFDTLVIDEASQALEPECWNAILKCKRVILAGDHLQLSPTVKSPQAENLGLSDTLLQRLSDRITSSFLLTTQYRMNDKILSFSNAQFYNNQLKSAEGISNWTLEGDGTPLVFIDTSGCGFEENYNPKTRSRYNEGEFFILREHFLQHKEIYQNHTIGIISPYAEQVKFLKRKVEVDDCFRDSLISINSIDGFQGQEKDVIYISLVRSNNAGDIGFLKDEKRLNVAMTRARKKLIIIGDMSTLSLYPLYNTLADHIEKEGSYKSAWEYMSY